MSRDLFRPVINGLLFDATNHFYPSLSFGVCDATELFEHKTSSYYGYVLSGDAIVRAQGGGEFFLVAGMYFSLPGPVSVVAQGTTVVFERAGYRALSLAGGPVEQMGRLSYIDNCTASLIVAPARLGDPCLNQLVFPAGILQTLHTHPSVRLGVVYEGHGFCHLEGGLKIPLESGMAFYLPPHQRHCFESRESRLCVIAYHPDSDYGPTDEAHPMINRTYIQR